MGETISTNDFKEFCNSHIRYAVDEGEAEVRMHAEGAQSVHYETSSEVTIYWANGDVVEVTAHEETDQAADKQITVDFTMEPPQVNEIVTTARTRKSRTLKGQEISSCLAELSKRIGLIPMLGTDVVNEVMPEADMAVSRLFSV